MIDDGSGYTEAINLLNYSAIVIPVSKADKERDVVDASYPNQPLSAEDQLNWEACKRHWSYCFIVCPQRHLLISTVTYLDDPELYHGAPIGVQLVARKFEEEKILAIAEIVTAALQEFKDVPQ